MASHTEINVGDTCWVIRISGEDVAVKVLEKMRKASGRGWEFRVKRFQNGRSVGRNLTRGSGALRRAGEPVKSTGFSKNGSAPKAPKAPKAPRAPKRRARARTAPLPTPPAPSRYARNPPASAFFSGVQEPGAPRSATASSPAAEGLGSLRGRGRKAAKRPTAPARKEVTPAAARREIEKLLKKAEFSPLVANLVKGLIRCDGSELAASRIYGDAMAEHRMGPFRIGSYRR